MNPENPYFSVIIPTYKRPLQLAKCLESITHLDYPKTNFEVIVVDDGSTDATRNVATTFPIILLTQHHEGKTAALNKGWKAANNPIIFTIDADTIIDKDCLQHIVKPLARKEVGATSGSCKVRNNTTWLTAFQNVEYHLNNLIRANFSAIFKTGIWFFGALACYKKSALEKVGGFKQDTLTEDADLALELHKYGYTTVNV
ncbi:MAG: glycosyltransferase family 2 protein, partial [Candidatus Dadabacteria bacterium]|nr:glycosyltransferase family 2 protein [Candidatus Dadabacteria bacterium]